MSNVCVYTHVCDDSYINVSCSDLQLNLEDLIEVIQKRKGNGLSHFSYDDGLWNVKLGNGLPFANALYSGAIDRQTSVILQKTFLMGACQNKIDDCAQLETYVRNNESVESSDRLFCSLWGMNFEKASICFLKNKDDENVFFEDVLKKNRDNEAFWQIKSSLLPNLKFTEDIERMVSVVSGKEFNSVLTDLELLNEYLNSVPVCDFLIKNFCEATCVDASPEDDGVKNQRRYRDLRMFNIPGKGSQYCDLHMKTPNHRTYIYPDKETQTMWIVYIGTHLATPTYRT